MIYFFDILGTFVFAISGALVASKKDFDLFGVLVLAFVTAVGGGMLRDILINAHPINWIGDLNYMWTIMVAVLFTFLFKKQIAPLSQTLFLFDTLGIGLFTLLGLQKGLDFGLHPFVAITMGISSAVMGGVIRDVLTAEVPLIFKKEIYASACFVGGLVYLLALKLNLNPKGAFVLGFVVIVTIRLLAVKHKLQLPKIK